MDSLSDLDKLRLLDDCGLRVDTDGILTDWQDRPAKDPRPTRQVVQHRETRHAFTHEEDELLRRWCAAAQVEGIVGSRVFEQLEAVQPNHTWQAYQNRYRKSLKDTPPPVLSTSQDFPNLDGSLYPNFGPGPAGGSHSDHTELESVERGRPPEDRPQIVVGDQRNGDRRGPQREHRATGAEETQAASYKDQRIDIDHVLYSRLGVTDEVEFRQFLRQPWVHTVYAELIALSATCGLVLDQPTKEGQLAPSRSQHTWKLTRAEFFLSAPAQTSSRYTTDAPDTAVWTEDDLDIRFLVRAVLLGSAPGGVWYRERENRNWRGPCDKALELLLWFKWLHKTTDGSQREMQRLQQKRARWINFLAGMPPAQPPLGPAPQKTAPEQELSVGSATASGRRQELQRQLYLLSDDARKFYLTNRDTRLSSWGVDYQHSKTCVLVPATWAATNPMSLACDPEAWPREEPGLERLSLSITAITQPWARWSAWFEDWPRTPRHLQDFLPPAQPSRMHGSHLCHHGLCIVPSHIVYEDRTTNLGRYSCASAAVALRSYVTPVPQYCLNENHEPRCLLQLAALTSYEAFATQFNVLRIAKDLPALPPLPRPSHHPHRLPTFFQGPAPSAEFPDVGVQYQDVVRLPNDRPGPKARGFRWSCTFCPNHRSFSKITSFWAHVRTQHEDTRRAEVLGEVRRSAQANEAWAHQHFYDYRRQNPVTWQKLQQAQATDFDWQVFAGWRLTRARLYKGRKDGCTASSRVDDDNRDTDHE